MHDNGSFLPPSPMRKGLPMNKREARGKIGENEVVTERRQKRKGWETKARLIF